MNTGFYKDLDTNFEQALEMSDKEFLHEELIAMLQNGNIPERQIAALKLENVNILDLYNDPDFSFDNELFRSYVKADGLHPNDDGHKAIAKKIYEYVKSM